MKSHKDFTPSFFYLKSCHIIVVKKQPDLLGSHCQRWKRKRKRKLPKTLPTTTLLSDSECWLRNQKERNVVDHIFVIKLTWSYFEQNYATSVVLLIIMSRFVCFFVCNFFFLHLLNKNSKNQIPHICYILYMLDIFENSVCLSVIQSFLTCSQ